MVTMSTRYGIPTFKTIHGKAQLPKLPDGKSYFSKTDNKISFEEVKKSQPANSAEREVKKLLSNKTIFAALSSLDKSGTSGGYQLGTSEGITRKDLKLAAEYAGNKKVIDRKDIIGVLKDRLKANEAEQDRLSSEDADELDKAVDTSDVDDTDETSKSDESDEVDETDKADESDKADETDKTDKKTDDKKETKKDDKTDNKPKCGQQSKADDKKDYKPMPDKKDDKKDDKTDKK